MFGVRSRGITFGPWKHQGDHPWMNHPPIYLPVGKKLFTLSTASFEMLSLEHIIYPPASYCSMDRSLRWSWEQLRRQPFKVDDVASYTLHADKRTFLISTRTDAAAATFAFDTKALSWKLLGNWALPFAGRGHFVPHLRAFVGLSKDPDTLGQLYSCDVPSFDDAGDGQCPAPASRVCNEKLFSDNPAERHVSATLVDMRCDGEFCLVERVFVAADQALVEEGDARLPGRCFYRVATFFLTYGMNGDLTTRKSRQVQYYQVPEATSKLFLAEDPVAFWM
ncbi:hypothetical protein CFC21_020946 [Triticum aestivum]|uniref:DUF1618 domain-containing protein n=2 Tax=Triticum aestivum TaxID=4565 RepID=A0A3B6ASH7_WHEAT|nr:hypothetical protein CFC21_020946 [Triticum aestivum]